MSTDAKRYKTITDLSRCSSGIIASNVIDVEGEVSATSLQPRISASPTMHRGIHTLARQYLREEAYTKVGHKFHNGKTEDSREFD